MFMCQRILLLALLTLTSGRSLVPTSFLNSPRRGGSAATVVQQEAPASAADSSATLDEPKDRQKNVAFVSSPTANSTVYDAGEVIVGDPAEVSAWG